MVAVPHSDLHSNILKVLATSTVPKGSTAISKELPVGGRPKAKELAQLLSEMVAAGSIVEFPGKPPKFARGPVESWVRSRVLEMLTAGKQEEPKLTKALIPHEHLLAEVMTDLQLEGKVFAHPPLSAKGKILYAMEPPEVLTYIGKELDKLLAAAQEKGFTQVAIRAAVLSRLAPESLYLAPARRPPIVETIRRLEPRAERGVAVAIVSLRKELAGHYDHASIDKEILALARQAILDLHSHAWPARLSADEKRCLIEDGRGGWFDSVTLRRK
jgi:hypothetical protein